MKPCRNNPVNTVGPAAFRRLCVETTQWLADGAGEKSAAFRRLCVETPSIEGGSLNIGQPPLGGCVLKQH